MDFSSAERKRVRRRGSLPYPCFLYGLLPREYGALHWPSRSQFRLFHMNLLHEGHGFLPGTQPIVERRGAAGSNAHLQRLVKFPRLPQARQKARNQ